MSLCVGLELSLIRVESFPSGGVWYWPATGMTVVYGLNGVGKSRLIRGIKQLFGNPEESALGVRSTGFLDCNLNLSVFEQSVFSIVSAKKSEIYQSPVHFPHEILERFNLESLVLGKHHQFGLPPAEVLEPLAPIPESMRSALVERFKDLLSEHRSSNCSGDNQQALISEYNDFLDSALLEPSEWHLVAPKTELSAIFDSLRTSIVEVFSTEMSQVTVDDIRDLFTRYGFETLVDENLFRDRALTNAPASVLIELCVFQMLKRMDTFLSTPAFAWEGGISAAEATDSLKTLMPDFEKTISALMAPLMFSRQKPSFFFDNRRIGPIPQFGLAVKRNSESAEVKEAVIAAVEALDEISRLAKEDTALAEALGAFAEEACPIFGIGMQGDIGHELRYFDNPFYLQYERFFDVEDFSALDLVDLDSEYSLDELAQRTFDFAQVEIVSDWEEIGRLYEVGGADEIKEILKPFRDAIVEYRIGITDVTILQSYRSHVPAFFFRTVSTGKRWIEFESLSAAQQYWVSAGIRIIAATEASRKVVIVGDEPERGLHERAVRNVLESLSHRALMSVITSHSMSALTIGNARLLHLELQSDGEVRLSPPFLGDDIAAAAHRFGTSPFELLSMKRLMVLVEGAHDEEIVRGLASLHPEEQILEKILIVPMGGVRKIPTVADSLLVSDFTDLHVLAIADNGRISFLRESLQHLESLIAQGQTPDAAIRQSGLLQRKTQGSDEERQLLTLLERFVVRGMTDRLRLFAIPAKDIVDLLPPNLFGLEKGWAELRSDYSAYRTESGETISFKDWLRKDYSTSISIKSIRRAFSQLDSISGPLQDLYDEVYFATSLSSLDRTLNNL